MSMSNPFCPPFQRFKPAPQPYYHFDGDVWREVSPVPPPTGTTTKVLPSKIKLISWNIDALGQGAVIRMESALSYLERFISSLDDDTPIVIFLQEMLPSDLEQIQAAPWIRERFDITDLSHRYWESMWYGTTTLIDRRLKVEKVFRVHMETRMERDGLFTDVAVAVPGPPGDGPYTSTSTATLRLCNAHLESLAMDPPLRPGQVKLASEYMHEPLIHASVLAGDCNSIQPFDRTIHSDHDLKDAFLELGGKEDTDESYTWGQMADPAQRDRFGCSRMDKILYCGGVWVNGFGYVGVDVKVPEEEWKVFRSWGVTNFVTDHYGVMGDLVVVPSTEDGSEPRRESSNL